MNTILTILVTILITTIIIFTLGYIIYKKSITKMEFKIPSEVVIKTLEDKGYSKNIIKVTEFTSPIDMKTENNILIVSSDPKQISQNIVLDSTYAFVFKDKIYIAKLVSLSQGEWRFKDSTTVDIPYQSATLICKDIKCFSDIFEIKSL